MSEHENGITYSVTKYRGFEREAIRVMNLTRVPSKSKAYMDWRYEGLKAPLDPLIYWAHGPSSQRKGMTTVIFRKYCKDEKIYFFAVGGDMSVDPKYSGRGIAKNLLKLETKDLSEKNIDFGIGIANPASKKIHSHAGWECYENFTRHIFILNPIKKINNVFRIKKICKLLGIIYKWLAIEKIKKLKFKDIRIQLSDQIGDEFDELWQSINKKGYIIGDRGKESLVWRYKNHPIFKFEILKFYKDNLLIGYMIYTLIDNNSICKVYDFLSKENVFIKPIVALFLNHIIKIKDMEYIWIDLNGSHPYSDILADAGFRRRTENTYLMIFDPSNWTLNKSTILFFTNGDKDI